MIGICIPAYNEEELLGHCLESAWQASQHPALHPETVVIVVVLDSCQDDSAAVASRWPVIPLQIAAKNVGKARSHGADYLLRLGARWLAFTDADSCVSPTWLRDQLSLQADVVCGTVEVRSWAEHGIHAAQAQRHFESSYADHNEHRHVHGANLGISAWHYRQAGGFEPRTCGEDQALVDRLSAQGAHIAWSALPRVSTSARPYSRVDGGFAAALRAGWNELKNGTPALSLLPRGIL